MIVYLYTFFHPFLMNTDKAVQDIKDILDNNESNDVKVGRIQSVIDVLFSDLPF